MPGLYHLPAAEFPQKHQFQGIEPGNQVQQCTAAAAAGLSWDR
ncbi:uncharacterized protein METZ01_LOCUS126080 [marine metagenome]|uniref:Uncharacterized protein n=1 Tax=marine metagenome TaxID=408172 RepID=A0A381Y801_9ZZZZ